MWVSAVWVCKFCVFLFYYTLHRLTSSDAGIDSLENWQNFVFLSTPQLKDVISRRAG